MEMIRNKRILAAVGIVCLFLGTVLPYFTFSFLGYSQSITLWGYLEGKIIVVLTLANTLFIFKDFIEKYIPQLFNSNMGRKIANVNNPKMSLIPTVLVIIFVIYLNNKFDFDLEYLKNGLGFYLLWIGIIGLAAHAFLYKKPAEQSQVSYNQSYNNQAMSQNANMQQPTQQQSVTPMQNSQGNMKYCPQCGNQVDGAASQCFMCGHNF